MGEAFFPNCSFKPLVERSSRSTLTDPHTWGFDFKIAANYALFRMIYVFLHKQIVFLLFIKVDGQLSRSNRDKCPVDTRLYICYSLKAFED
jgi:hypothetical protein